MSESLRLQTTPVLKRIASAIADGNRLLILQGGTSAGKTWSVLQYLLLFALQRARLKRPTLISVVSESIPHLKRGCIRDWKRILDSQWRECDWNATDRIYKIGCVTVEFFPADDSRKLRGGRRDVLFINEANNVTKASYDELSVRTLEFIIIDFNPVYEFWAHSLIGKPGVVFHKSTYLDAKAVLPKTTIDDIESRRDTDPNWWRVYGLGEIGNIEGLVHPFFDQIDDMPDVGDGIEVFGLDFGYSQDPAALVRVVIKGQDMYCDQLIYETGLDNNALANRMASLGLRKNYDEIFADAAEPKSIAEIKAYGWNIKPAPKGPDSITAGIQRVNQYRQYWTKRSVDAIKEQRNYRYIETSDGKITAKPISDYNHCMDSRRYAVLGKLAVHDAWATGSVFHSKPNTDVWEVDAKHSEFTVSLFGFSYDNNRIYGVRVIHDQITNRCLFLESRELSTMQEIASWVKSAPHHACFADRDFLGDSLRTLYRAFNSKPYNLGLVVQDRLDEPGLILFINGLLRDGRFYVAPDSAEFRLMMGATDTRSPFIRAMFSVMESLHVRKLPKPDSGRTIFHTKYARWPMAKIQSNGFVE